MEGRASLLLALGILASTAGCTPQGGSSLLTPGAGTDATAAAAQVTPEPADDSKPLRQPKPATCVAAGRLREQEANDPRRTPLERERMLDQARKAYQQALANDPDCIPAWEALGRLYATMGQPERAVETYRKGLEKHPKEAGLWYALGMCQSRQKQWDAALASLNKAVELDPENRQYVHTLGFCLARAGRYDESLATFRKVESPAQAEYNLARMLHHLKQDDLSKQHLRLALQADPRLEPARQLLQSLESGASGAVQVGFEAPDAPAARASH